MRCLFLLLVGLGLVADVGAQAPATPGQSPGSIGIILGKVVDAATNAPLPGVAVSFSGPPPARPVSALTDSQGRFVFRNVPKGDVTLRATVGGTGYSPSGFFYSGGVAPQIGQYLSGGYGQRRPGGPMQTLDMGDGERLADVVIKLWKGGAIDGTVVDEAGEPLVNAIVAAAKRSTDGRLLQGPSTSTDDRGAYHLGTLVPGDYVVVVPQMQALMPASTADALATAQPGDRSIGSALANTGGASVAGGLAVGDQLLIGDRTTFDLASNILPPSMRGAELFVYQTTFAPTATLANQATVIAVQSGETRTSVTVRLQPVRAVSVNGSVSDDSGPVPNFGVRLMPADASDGSALIEVARTSTDGRGLFTFPLVPVGSYRLIARRETTTSVMDETGRQRSPTPTRLAERIGASAERVIAVGDRGASGVALTLRPGVSINGRVDFRGSGSRPPVEAIQRALVSVALIDPVSRLPNVSRSGRIDADGTFAIQNVVSGRYTMWSDSLAGWTMSDVTISGRPVLDRGFQVDTTDVGDVTVVLTDRPAEVTGTVRNRDGAGDANAAVYLFPTDRTRWRDARTNTRTVRAVRVSRKGDYRLTAVPPGEYFIAALADEQADNFPDERFLALLAAVSKTVTVAAGEKPAVQLATASLPVSRRVTPAARASTDEALSSRSPHGPFVDESVDVQQQPVSAVLTLSGVVVSDATPAQPLRRVLVTITAAEIRNPRQAVTDDEGRFSIEDLPPGRYSIVADKPGYVKVFFGSKRPGRPPGTPVDLAAGKPAVPLVVHMPRGAVIAGTVRDQFGAPMASAQVSLRQPIVVNGQRRMINVPNLPFPWATTDDLGRYRFYGLPAGEYTVQAGPGPVYSGVRETTPADIESAVRDVQAPATSATKTPLPEPRSVTILAGYLPGVADAGAAELITLGAGEERLGADFITRMVHVSRVSGISLGPDGGPATNALIGIVNAADRTTWSSAGSVRPGPDGRFTTPALQPGRWALVGRAGENGAGESDPLLMSGEVEFVLGDEDVSGVVLHFDRGVTVSGKIGVPPGSVLPDLSKTRLTLTNVDGLASFTISPPPAIPQSDGSFQFPSIGPGKWRLGGAWPNGWTLRSAIFNGRDTLDVPLEVAPGQAVTGLQVTITNHPAAIVGSLLDTQGRATSAYSMLAFSTDRSLWTTAPRPISGAVRLSSDGKYRIEGLAPGEYYLCAISDFEPVQLGDPAFLESLIGQAVRVKLGEGETLTRDLRVGG